MNVFQISQALERIDAAIEAAGGEVVPEIEAMLHELSNAKSDKLQALAKLIKKNDADEIAIDDEIKRLRTLKNTTEAKRKYLEKLVRTLLLEGETWQEGSDRFSWRKSTSVNVVDGVELPEAYYRSKIVSEVDKTKLSVDLKGGATIPGASLQTKYNLVVR